MLRVKVMELSYEGFRLYGTYADMMNPQGYGFGENPVVFYRDMLQQSLGMSTNASFSVCTVWKRPLIIDCSEYHDHCAEAIMPMDGDILMHVGPAVSEVQPPAELIEVFRIPKGTMVVTHPGVWHQAGFPYKCDFVNILCILPERTYSIDCHLKNLPDDKCIEIQVDEIIL